MKSKKYTDVVILGAGLAGLSLARQLLINSKKKIIHIEKRPKVPTEKQKVGESSVQVGGYYFSKVLDMEEHLYHQHVMKYNLRFLWKTANSKNDDIEHYSQSYIRTFSNIASYQIDRNKFEKELINLNTTYPNYHLLQGAKNISVKLNEGKRHKVSFKKDNTEYEINAHWVIDATGLARYLAKNLQLKKESTINHSSTFFWVDGNVNIEKLTHASHNESRVRKARRSLGHSPFWLATNHFCGEGFWFWVIPLQGRSSFGLVYDNEVIDSKIVATPEKFLKWLFKEFPLFKKELKNKELIDFQCLRNYAYDCEHTLSKNKYALTGFSGRFNDPLYSPGGDAIAIYNTLIIDCILTNDKNKLNSKIQSYDKMMDIFFQSFLPSYIISYDALGDQETCTMKYVWELTIYFGFYVFPFINDLHANTGFLIIYFRRFAQLGPMNRTVQGYVSNYFQWKKKKISTSKTPHFFEFKQLEPLVRAEKTFYEVDMDVKSAKKVLDAQLIYVTEFALYLIAHIDSVIFNRPDLVDNSVYLKSINLSNRTFDTREVKKSLPKKKNNYRRHKWTFDTTVLREHFHSNKS